MKFYLLLFLQISILIASSVYCVVPPNLLNDHCYGVDPNMSYIHKNMIRTPISQICFHESTKSYDVASNAFVAWHVTITSMATERMKFRVWKVENLNIFVSCQFATEEEALNFHREIYDDRLYDVPTRLQVPAAPVQWQPLPRWLINGLSNPFKMQRSNNILAVAMVPKRINDEDSLIDPIILAKQSNRAELFYENYYKPSTSNGEFLKIFTITAVDETTNVNTSKPVVIFAPDSFQLIHKLSCDNFIVILILNKFYIIGLATDELRDNVYDTFYHFTDYRTSCPVEVTTYLEQLKIDMYN